MCKPLEYPAAEFVQKERERDGKDKAQNQIDDAHSQGVAHHTVKIGVGKEVSEMLEPNPLLIKESALRLIVLERHGKAPQRRVGENQEVDKKRKREQRKLFLRTNPVEKSFFADDTFIFHITQSLLQRIFVHLSWDKDEKGAAPERQFRAAPFIRPSGNRSHLTQALLDLGFYFLLQRRVVDAVIFGGIRIPFGLKIVRHDDARQVTVLKILIYLYLMNITIAETAEQLLLAQEVIQKRILRYILQHTVHA